VYFFNKNDLIKIVNQLQMKILIVILIIILYTYSCNGQKQTEKSISDKITAFQNPPDSARPSVYWMWINGNITKKGITADLKAMKKVGIGGVLWLESGGPQWAPAGQVEPYGEQWQDMMQWAIQECERLGLEFKMNMGYGYGAGGPHITPDISMQKLYWSKTLIEGGKSVDIILEKPEVTPGNALDWWLKQPSAKAPDGLLKRPSFQEAESVLDAAEQLDFYRDVAILAIPYSSEVASFKIPQLNLRSGLASDTYFLKLEKLLTPKGAVVPKDSIIDLTKQMNADGTLSWVAPPGKWQIIRLGHGPNFRLSRPVPTGAVGLESNKLSPDGINVHFEAFLKPIVENAKSKKSKKFHGIHIESYEDGPQNWTAEFPQEFLIRQGYDIRPWLPVLTGIVVESPELTERFLWDFRETASEMFLDNYVLRLKELASEYGIKLGAEPYGNISADKLKYHEATDFPYCEFWQRGEGKFPNLNKDRRMKLSSSAAHVNGLPQVGAEAFTQTFKHLSWREHAFILKGIADAAYCKGVNHICYHCSPHQAYDDMIPGLTHRHAGGHFHRHNTWWKYSKQFNEYMTRCQYMLQQGQFVADVIYFFGEGAPLSFPDMFLDLPQGYDYDFCSAEILQMMEVRDGNIILPSGMTYRFLFLPNTDRLTLSSVEKIKELVESGAQVIAQKRVVGTPGLSGYPEADEKVKHIASQLWDKRRLITERNWEKIFQNDNIQPRFKGKDLNFIHRKTDIADIYFVANPEPIVVETKCSFWISGKIPELWNPETGEIRDLPEYELSEGRVLVPLHFEPFQSWFVVFRKTKATEFTDSKNFPEYHYIKDINGPWQVNFDSKLGGPEDPVTFASLKSWSEHSDKGIRYYSGTAIYKKTINLLASELSQSAPLLLDLGQVEIIAQVRVNGKNCGIAWKPPYRVDISNAVKLGDNKLEIAVVNLWANRMIGDEQFPDDCDWITWQTLKEWPEWFMNDDVPRPTERLTFTTNKIFEKDDPLLPSGLIGPVRICKPTWKGD